MYERIFSGSMTVAAFEKALADAAQAPAPGAWWLGLIGGVMAGWRYSHKLGALSAELN